VPDTYRILPDEPIAVATRRIVAALVEDAIRQRDRSDVDTAVHEIRKRCKEGRAVLRLVRGAAPFAQTEIHAMRDAARIVGDVRDRRSLELAVDALATGGRLDEGLESGMRKHLASRPVGDRSAAELVDGVIERLVSVRQRIPSWELAVDGWDAVRPGLERTARRARARLRDVHVDPSADAFHEWRKRVKDARHHAELLLEVAPLQVEHHELLVRLSDVLGLHHDLSMLRATVSGQAGPMSSELAERAGDRIFHRQAELAAQALDLGATAFADSVEDRLATLEATWRGGRTAVVQA